MLAKSDLDSPHVIRVIMKAILQLKELIWHGHNTVLIIIIHSCIQLYLYYLCTVWSEFLWICFIYIFIIKYNSAS